MFRPSFFLTTALSMFSLWSTCSGHGYTTNSRNFLCKNGNNFSCGSIIYEPQSLEAPKGFPDAGPADGQLASAGIARFSQLDEQTPFRWVKTDVQEGPFDIAWSFTANHRTTGYEYYMTNPDWDPNSPLTRSQFDLSPFCTVNSGGAQPPISGETHSCDLPSRSGYHVILAVWIIDDTTNAFYNMIDVRYGGANPPPAPTTPSPVAPPTTPIPTISPAPSPVPPPPGALCSSGLPLEAVDDCTAFVYCANGAVAPNTNKVPCPNGLLFSNNAQICDWESNVECDSSGTVPTNAPIAFPAATSAPVGPATPAPGGGGSGLCSSGMTLEPTENCLAFVHCVNGAVVPGSLTYCPNGLLFSATTLVCDWPSNVICN